MWSYFHNFVIMVFFSQFLYSTFTNKKDKTLNFFDFADVPAHESEKIELSVRSWVTEDSKDNRRTLNEMLYSANISTCGIYIFTHSFFTYSLPVGGINGIRNTSLLPFIYGIFNINSDQY